MLSGLSPVGQGTIDIFGAINNLNKGNYFEAKHALEDMSDEELSETIARSPYNHATSNDIDWVAKVKMQGMIQKHIDHSISCTVNLPEDATEDMVRQVYEEAYRTGCKGITVYRDQSRDSQVLESIGCECSL